MAAKKPKTTRAWFVCLNGKPLVKVGGYPRDEAKFVCASKEATARRLSSYAPAKYTVAQFTLTPVKKADLAALAEARKAAEWARLVARAMKARFPFTGQVCRELFDAPEDADGLPVHTPELEAVLRAAIKESQ